MAFALYYDMQDLQAINDVLQRANLQYANNQDRTLIRNCWAGGLSSWQTAPLANPLTEPTGGDSDCRRVVVTATAQGSTVTLAAFLAALSRTVPANPKDPDNLYGGGIEFLNAIVADASTTGKDPFP